MGPHSAQYALSVCEWTLSDPGSSGALPSTQTGVLPLVTAGAETRTLAAPTKNGLTLTLVGKTLVGNCVVTVASAYDENGGTTLTFSEAGQYVKLESVAVSSTAYAWRVVGCDGVTGPTLNPGALEINGVITDGLIRVSHQCLLNADCVDQAFFIADRAYQVTRIDEVHATAGSDGSAVNLQITKDTGTAAPGAGTDLLTNNTNAGFDMKGTANTVQNGTLTGTTASLQLAAGDRLSLDFAGTVTALAGVVVTVTLKAI